MFYLISIWTLPPFQSLYCYFFLSPLVRHCQQALNDISAWHAVGLYWVPGHTGVRGNEIADKPARSGSVQRFVGPEPFLGLSSQNIRGKIKCWMEKQHLALWRGPCSTQRQARELISGPNLATGARLLSFNRTQSMVVIGLLTRHNTLRRHLYIMGLSNNSTCRKCGTEEETSFHIFVSVRPWPHSGTWRDPKITGIIFLKGSLGFILLQLWSPSKYSPFDSIHLYQRFSHC